MLVDPLGFGSGTDGSGRIIAPMLFASDRPVSPVSAPMREGTTIRAANAGELLSSIARNRDRSAFRQLFEYYAPRVKGYLRSQGCNDAVAEDLAQEAMLRVWHKAHQFDPAKASPATWIFTIARNLRIDAIRRERRPEPDPDEAASTALPQPQPDALVEVDERDRNLRNALADLPPDQADIVRLSFFEDRSHSEIAADLGLPLGTVKSRLRLAFARIRKSIGAPV